MEFTETKVAPEPVATVLPTALQPRRDNAATVEAPRSAQTIRPTLLPTMVVAAAAPVPTTKRTRWSSRQREESLEQKEALPRML